MRLQHNGAPVQETLLTWQLLVQPLRISQRAPHEEEAAVSRHEHGQSRLANYAGGVQSFTF